MDPGVFYNGLATGVHMGGINFNFVDGHASTFNILPIVNLWYTTGGGGG